MKVKSLVLSTFLIGALLGAVAAATLVANHYKNLFEDWYLMGVAEQAHIAHQIKTGKSDRLAAGIETSLPGYLLAIESQFGRSDQALPALWSVRDFYRASGTPVPEEVADLLEDLPPKPVGCCPVSKPELR
jgi:hypothetical protein